MRPEHTCNARLQSRVEVKGLREHTGKARTHRVAKGNPQLTHITNLRSVPGGSAQLAALPSGYTASNEYITIPGRWQQGGPSTLAKQEQTTPQREIKKIGSRGERVSFDASVWGTLRATNILQSQVDDSREARATLQSKSRPHRKEKSKKSVQGGSA